MRDYEVIDAEATPANEAATLPTKVDAHHQPLMTLDSLHNQVQTIQQVMHKVMKTGEHYGTIPGCGPKPTLLQPGAQKLALTFGFSSEYRVEQTNLPNGHREYNVRCRLMHRQTGAFVGEGVGVGSTMEGKYRFRNQQIPTGQPIPQDYQQNKGAYRAKGYAAKKDDATGEWQWCRIERGEHDNPADHYNTVLKMAKKRAYVDAVLTATAASDLFTQDLEDTVEAPAPPQAQSQQQGQAPQQQAPPQSPPQQQQAPAQQQASGGQNYTKPTEPGEGVYHVAEVKLIKQGQNNNGPWSMHAINTREGIGIVTFDATHASIAGEALERGTPVRMKWSVDNRGAKLQEIDHAQASGGQQAPTQQQANPTGDQGQETVVIQSVEEKPVKWTDGSEGTLYVAVTDKGRFGITDQQLGEQAKASAGTGEGLLVQYVTEQRGKRITSINPLPW